MIDMSMCTREGVLILCYFFIQIISLLNLYLWCMLLLPNHIPG